MIEITSAFRCILHAFECLFFIIDLFVCNSHLDTLFSSERFLRSFHPSVIKHRINQLVKRFAMTFVFPTAWYCSWRPIIEYLAKHFSNRCFGEYCVEYAYLHDETRFICLKYRFNRCHLFLIFFWLCWLPFK